MLSILCVTSGQERATPFISEMDRLSLRLNAELVVLRDGIDVHSKGYIESVLEEAISRTHGQHILRLDDDEMCSPAMVRWLEAKEYEKEEVWSFPRVHFWGDNRSVIVNRYYFPDFQTRLTTRAKAGGRTELHQGCPWGFGTIARVCIEHYVYLVKSYEERCETGRRYQQIRAGGDGGEFRASSIEDEAGDSMVDFMEYNDGTIPMRGRMWQARLR